MLTFLALILYLGGSLAVTLALYMFHPSVSGAVVTVGGCALCFIAGVITGVNK